MSLLSRSSAGSRSSDDASRPGFTVFPGTRWRRLVGVIALMLFVVSCIPANVSSDTPVDEERAMPARSYHVQVRTVEEKEEADRAVSDVMAWFDDLDRKERPLPLSRVSTVPVDVRWKAPFYRVRVGPFTSKEAAESVLESIQSAFPDAFIARGIIEDARLQSRPLWLYEEPQWHEEPQWRSGGDGQRAQDRDRRGWEDDVANRRGWDRGPRDDDGGW